MKTAALELTEKAYEQLIDIQYNRKKSKKDRTSMKIIAEEILNKALEKPEILSKILQELENEKT